MAIRRTFALAAGMAIAAIQSAGMPASADGLASFEGRWVPIATLKGFAGRIGPIEIMRCDPQAPTICFMPVGADGACGAELLPLMPAGGGALEGAYRFSLGVPETETDDDAYQRLRHFRIDRDGERIRFRVSPSILETMLSRAALDDAVVWMDRAGPPECPRPSPGVS